ncbi:MAG TPA: D-glycero-beta-D-manno-heptose-7-phosphate kinase [Bacteroidota bacterium]|nr:D-glycero-beta-D-manno-heptose-7-phosphate kinase [Bacteroidota bacterium]
MKGRRIAVIGDLMVDRYIWGSVSRISPEAPVPVIDMDQEQDRLGGAANVAKNIKSLGGNPLLIGIIGADNSGKRLHEIVRESEFSTEGIVVDGTRPTTVKTRVIAHSQHVVRIDREQKSDISFIIQNRIMDILRHQIDAIDGIIIEDYNKGVVVKGLIKQVIDLARETRKPITIDPKFNNFFEYQHVTVFKPNRKEVEEVLGRRLKTPEEIQEAGRDLLQKLRAANVLLTLGEHGMMLFESGGAISSVPTMARNVADVSGAGDTVIATLTMALAAGAGVREAATLANFAGGIVCGYVGIVPIDKRELRDSISAYMQEQPEGAGKA